jgi:hypothetical protein
VTVMNGWVLFGVVIFYFRYFLRTAVRSTAKQFVRQ